jgi:cytochrome P450
MAAKLPEASLAESLQFNQLVIIPNAVQGLFKRRPTPVAAATRFGVDGHAVRLMDGLRRKHGPGPLWIRVMTNKALLMLSTEDVRRVLEGSPSPFASDPEAKRKGMGHFQPDALTLSRGELWENRRRFAEAVLDSPQRVHSFADGFIAIVDEEISELPETLDYETFHAAFRRIVRRIVLGDAARDDEQVSELLGELMSEANKLPSEPSKHFEPYIALIRQYIEAAEEGSLVSRIPQAPHDDQTRAERQVTHWLFALQDTLAANCLRALALLASHAAQRTQALAELADAGDLHSGEAVAGLDYLRACLQEAMRLWPTTPLLSRETISDDDWNGAVVPAGTQILIVNIFHHRDRERLDYADRFAPEEWTEGDAGSDWSFNHFSHGPQGCPGSNLALLVGTAVLAGLLTARRPKLLEPTLDPSKALPHMLDFFRLRFAIEAPSHTPAAG